MRDGSGYSVISGPISNISYKEIPEVGDIGPDRKTGFIGNDVPQTGIRTWAVNS